MRLTEYVTDHNTPAIDLSKVKTHFQHGTIIGGDIPKRLAHYEDTGFEPEELLKYAGILHLWIAAHKEQRLTVISEARLPVIVSDELQDACFCPDCSSDLMGGFPENKGEQREMVQCPHCGQLIDAKQAVGVNELSHDSEGYVHFTLTHKGEDHKGLFRVRDPSAGEDMVIVAIDGKKNLPLHPTVKGGVEAVLKKLCDGLYNSLLDLEFGDKKPLLEAMSLVGYIYDEAASAVGRRVFKCGRAAPRIFENFNEVYRWIDGYIMLANDDALYKKAAPLLGYDPEPAPLQNILKEGT